MDNGILTPVLMDNTATKQIIWNNDYLKVKEQGK